MPRTQRGLWKERLLKHGVVLDSMGLQSVLRDLRKAFEPMQAVGLNLTQYRKGSRRCSFMKVGYQRFEQVIDVNASTPYLKIELETLPFQLQTIRVYGSNRSLSQFEETTDLVLDEAELQRRLGMTLANTLADETGISQRMMGRAIARPVIRGLGGDRLLILENGERTGDKSASSADHALSIDPTTAEGVEITRGPASLIYGSSTLGGVINVKSNNIPQILPRRLDMHLTFQGESVNSGLTGTTGFTFPIGDFAGNVEWNRRLASDIQTPVGVLENTALSNVNFSGGASLIKPWGFIGASGSSYRSDYGVPGSPEGHVSGVNIELDKQRYEGQMEYRFNTTILEKVKLQTAYTRYQHQEWESNGRLGVEFGSANLQCLSDGSSIRQRDCRCLVGIPRPCHRRILLDPAHA